MSMPAPPADHSKVGVYFSVVGGGPERLVFLHGLFGQGKNFTTIAKAMTPLASSMLVDLPNHGRSGWTDTLSLDDLADALAPTVAGFGGDSGVTLIGHSLGGKVAMRFALRHPQLVRRLVVIDISPVAGGVSESFHVIVPALQRLNLAELASRGEADEILARDIKEPAVRGFLLQNLRRVDHQWTWQMNLDLLAAGLDSIVGGWEPTSATFTKPTLWIAGADSPYVQPEHSEPMRALFPTARKMVVKDAGHWVHADQPDVLVALLTAFLRS